MQHTLLSSLELLYPLINDHEKRKEITEKVNAWMTTHKEELGEVQKKLALEIHEAKQIISICQRAGTDVMLPFITYYNVAAKFVNDVSFKFIDDENADVSNLMGALLLFRLVDCNEWTNLLKTLNQKEITSHTVYALIKYIFSQKHLDNDLISFFSSLIPLLKSDLKQNPNNTETFDYTQSIIALFFKEIAIRSLSSQSLMRMTSSVEEIAFFTLQLSIPPGFSSTAFINILKFIQDPVIFKNLMSHAYIQTVGNQSYAKEKQSVRLDIARTLHDATNEKTKSMWEHFKLPVFKLLEENETLSKNLYAKFPEISLRREIAKTNATYYNSAGELNIASQDQARHFCESLISIIKNASQPNLFHIITKNPTMLKIMVSYMMYLCTQLHQTSHQAALVKTSVKLSLIKIIKEIEKLPTNDKQTLWDRLFLIDFFQALQALGKKYRDEILSHSSIMSQRYTKFEQAEKAKQPRNATPATPLSKEQEKERKNQNKASISAQAPLKNENKITAIKKINPPSQPKKHLQEPPRREEKPLVLSQANKETFIEAIRAAFAGDPNIHCEWENATDNQSGYFILKFSTVSSSLQVREKLNQNPQTLQLTPEEREEFLNNQVQILFKRHLSNDASVAKVGEALHITPKKERCSYPVDMLSASFKLLNNHKKKQENNASALPSQKKSRVDTSLGQPKESLTSGAQKAADKTITTQEAPTQPMSALSIAQQLLRRITENHFPNQEFNFLTLKEEKNRWKLRVNTKGAPYLSNKEHVQIDTYLVIYSVVAALKDKYGKNRIHVTPDDLNPETYGQTSCTVTMNGHKQEWKKLAEDDMSELKVLFDRHLESAITIANGAEQTLQGDAQEPVLLTLPKEPKKNILYKPYQSRTMSAQQLPCLQALFHAMNELNAWLSHEKDPQVSFGIEAAKNVCYARIFHHMAHLFQANKDQTNHSSMMTLRDMFRYGYLEITQDTREQIEKLVTAFINMECKKSALATSASIFAPIELHHVSFHITRAMHDELTTKITPFIQQRSNHVIGRATKLERKKRAPDLEATMKHIASLENLNVSQKQTLVVALMSQVGEVKKEKPYVNVFNQLDAPDSLMTLPVHLHADIYNKFYQANETRPRSK